ncbi:MAG: hypothetical protein FWF59_07670 [Turicibacter sp.]|nr:hypothetical protein [Turicibacter sp.]
MVKKYKELEEGDIFSIQVSDNVWTIGQLCNLFASSINGKKYEQYTLAFFDYKFQCEKEILKNVIDLDLKKPISIITINGHPLKSYGLNFIVKREVSYQNAPDFKDDIDPEMGLYKLNSTDFQIILEPFFGIIPWDSYYKDGIIEKHLLKGVQKRNEVTYMKDYSIEELKQILPSDNFKLKGILEKENH